MTFRDTATIMADASSERGSKILKVLDRWIGIPLVFTLGLLCIRRRKQIPKNVRKIAILKTAAIGDTVLLTAILKDLKKAYPESDIHFFCGSSNYSFAKLLTECSKVIKLPLKNFLDLYKILKSDSYDLLLDFGAWPRINSVCSFFINSNCKVGFNTQNQYRHYVYDIAVPHSDRIHELENYRNILKNINVPIGESLSLPPGDDVSHLIQKISKPYVVCHMWPGGEKSYLKEWITNDWRSLIFTIIKTFDHDVVLTGGSEDIKKNKNFIQSLKYIDTNRDHIHDGAGINLSETIHILKRAKLVISVNTGIMHMAAAGGIKTVGLHGPTSVRRWGAIGKSCYNITPQLDGSGYLNLGFEYKPQLKCMESINYAQVLEAVSKVINENDIN